MSGFFSLVVALVLLLAFPRFWQWLAHATVGTSFAPFLLPDGTEVPYPQTAAFWFDLGPAIYTVAAGVEGVVLLALPKPIWLRVAAAGSAVAAVVNACVVIYGYSAGFGLQLASLLISLFAGWAAVRLWQLAAAATPRSSEAPSPG